MESSAVRSKKKCRSKFGRRKQRKRSCLRGRNKTDTKVKEEDEEEDGPHDGQSGVGNVGGGGSVEFCNNPSTLHQVEQEQLSMPVVTSRSKRFKGATAIAVAYTDRKTRSTITTQKGSQVDSGSTGGGGPFPCSNYSDSDTREVLSLNGDGENSDSTAPCDRISASFTTNTSGCASDTNHVTGNGSVSSRSNDSMKRQTGQEAQEEIETEEVTKTEKELLDISLQVGPYNATTAKKEQVTQGEKVENEKVENPAGEISCSPNLNTIEENACNQRDKQQSGGVGCESENVNNLFCAKISDRHNVTVTPKKINVSAGGGSAKKLKIVEERKQTLAPMLLLHNLPFMGEMTFDTRPRRGRKPKKVDICHLISKNYGIHFPNSYTNVPYTGQDTVAIKPAAAVEFKVKHGKKKMSLSSVSNCPPQTQPKPWTMIPSTPPALCRLNCPSSISKSKLLSSHSPSSRHSSSNKSDASSTRRSQLMPSANQSVHEEPLNLCVRDAGLSMSQNRFKMRQPTNHNASGSSYAESRNLKMPLLLTSNLFSDFQLNPNVKSTGNKIVQSPQGKTKGGSEVIKKIKSSGGSGDELVKFSRENTVSDLHLVNKFNFQLANLPESSSQPQSSQEKFRFVPPVVNPHTAKSESRKVCKRKLHSSLKTESGNVAIDVHTTTGGTLFGHAEAGPNSNAQVSICKFKFTGGAKPSLQEKKMLSVDSGGNFRFYTDKDKVGSSSSIKSAKSQGNLASFSSGGGDSHHDRDLDCQYAYASLPKSAKSMSVCMPVRPSSSTSSSSLKPSSSSGSGTAVGHSEGRSATTYHQESGGAPSTSLTTITPAPQNLSSLNLDAGSPLGMESFQFPGGEDGYSSSQSSESGPSQSSSMMFNELSSGQYNYDNEMCTNSRQLRLKRKRRTRKSLMREKLEKTFKEKGFLIQTQQLESAEGATYCKFRQLRKFTRYLFRSWKDYLPDTVREINSAGGSNQNVDGTGEWRDPSSLLAISAGGKGDSSVELDLSNTTTNSQAPVEDSDVDEDDDDVTRMELVPEVTLITQPSSPAITVDNDDINTDSEGSDDVDVEHIDDAGYSPRHNRSHHHNPGMTSHHLMKNSEDDSTTDNIDNDN